MYEYESLDCIYMIIYDANQIWQHQGQKSIGSTGAPLPGRDTFARKLGVITNENNSFLMQNA